MKKSLIIIGVILTFSALFSVTVLGISKYREITSSSTANTEDLPTNDNAGAKVLSIEEPENTITPTISRVKSSATAPTNKPATEFINPTTQNDVQFREQLVESINQYNEQVKQLQSQKAQACAEGTKTANQTYDPQIQTVQLQINDLENKKKEVCPYSEYAEACMVGEIRKQLDYLSAQINTLHYEISSLETNKNNYISLACGGSVSFPETPVENYIRSSVPTYYRIQSQGNGSYIIYDSNGSLYSRVQSDGFGGYVVY